MPRILLTLCYSFFFSCLLQGQFTVGIDRANGSGPTATNVVGPDAGCLTASTGLTRGAGLVENAGGDFNSRDWNTTSEAAAKAADDFLEFSFTVNDPVTLTALELAIDRSGTGPDHYLLEYSLDNFTTAGTEALRVEGVMSTTVVTYSATAFPVDFSGTLTYRLFAWGASSGNGTLDIEALGGTPVATDGIRITGQKATTAPVELIDFKVAGENRKAVLSWATATESGSEAFIIERSTDGGRNFRPLGQVNAAGSSQSTKTYQFIDEQPASGEQFYRLRQTDLDGRFTIYGPLRFQRGEGTKAVLIYPNPVVDQLVVNNLPPDTERIEIINAIGRNLRTVRTPDKNAELLLNLTGLPRGTYLLRIISEGAPQTRRFLKQ